MYGIHTGTVLAYIFEILVMNRLFFFICLPLMSLGQLKVEWKTEFAVGNTGVSGLVVHDQNIYVTQTGGASVFNILDAQGAITFTSLANNTRIRSLFLYNNFLYSMGDQHLTKRNLNGNLVSEKMLPFSENGFISATSGQIAGDRAYAIDIHNYFFKFALTGEQLFRKEIGTLTDNHFLDVGGNFIYVYSSITKPALGSRLMQYDTLGNQNWSIAAGGMVSNILADEDGNCYVLSANGESTIIKYDTEGKVIWSKLLTGQYAINGSLRGDSLLLCGNISLNAITDKNQSCAYSIMSVKTGEILSQQVVDLYEDINEKEMMTQIAGDGKNIYIGGTHGKMGGVTCFLIKLSKEGATGINEETKHKTFNIFPNPSGSKFTISSEEQGVQSLKVTVRNSLGQVVQKETLSSTDKKNYELDLGKHAAGNYTIEIESGKDKVVKKVVVE